MTESEFYYLLFRSYDDNIETVETPLRKKGFLRFDGIVTPAGINKLDTIFLESIDKSPANDNFYQEIAEELRAIYPQGRKEGTNYMWRGTTAEIVKKLKTIVIKYKFKFTKEQAIQATKAYVQSFNGNYAYMQLLKYFILKTIRDADGNVEIKSEFMSRIENASQEDEVDWTNILI